MKKAIAAWKKWARYMRVEAYTLYFAQKHPKTPWYAKIWSVIVVAYAFSPIDIIPDFIPILGFVDDLVLIPLGMAVAVKLIPKDILIESRQIAQKRIDRGKPVNWVMGGAIIGLWVLVFAFVAYRAVRKYFK
jgi:uncharacterized membrane protein YkvA (DUF1232 family)